jgi:hypothetical protein
LAAWAKPALAPFTGPGGLSFRIENQLAHAVRLAG